MECLLCEESIQSETTLWRLLTFSEEVNYLCASCKGGFQGLGKKVCQHCSKPLEKESCLDCQLWEEKDYIPNHVSLYCYQEAMKEYFSRYKFMGDYLLRKVFQSEINQKLKPFIKKGFVLIPVPISPERMNERGFNQVTGLLEGLEYEELFDKIDIEKQSSKNRRERLEQANPFRLKAQKIIPKNIIIVDDIYTTGATIYQLVTLLKEAGAEKIVSFSLAR